MEISIRNGVAMVGKSSGVLWAAYHVVGWPLIDGRLNLGIFWLFCSDVACFHIFNMGFGGFWGGPA